ncbi:DUF1272 domain-containing protein [Cytobacillus sp. IB215665]|uniref:DUF1272 domain-containing protein n=1 Tax=Cytobacillus sp. IB215665 TaxID=3097357 RepID=UPI002A0B3F28|nr:DUF1272 domain-containing protein [Cytobacillus sp. IB215665]MDX8366158.1 DUF1272 domain-containing protein [Cytobacillus sp. IB215665]
MGLKMKKDCQRCDISLTRDADAYICSYECTFCPQCSAEVKNVCPNCGGELVRRPKRDGKLRTVMNVLNNSNR